MGIRIIGGVIKKKKKKEKKEKKEKKKKKKRKKKEKKNLGLFRDLFLDKRGINKPRADNIGRNVMRCTRKKKYQQKRLRKQQQQ